MLFNEALIQELKKASADFTLRKVACIIVDTNGNTYSGHNSELTLQNIIHAEQCALSKIAQGGLVQEIHLLGNGSIKHAIPCERCMNELAARTNDAARIFLYDIKNLNKKYTCSMADLIASYAKRETIIDLSNSLRKDLPVLTSLNGKDSNLLDIFIKNIINDFPADALAVYLTGTAAGLSPRKLFVGQKSGKKNVGINLVFIFKKKTDESLLEKNKRSYRNASGVDFQENDLLVEELPPYTLEDLDKEQSSGGFLWRKEFSIPSLDVVAIDISVGTDLASVMTKQYLSKNWLVKLA